MAKSILTMGHPFTVKTDGSKRPNLICFKLGSQGNSVAPFSL